MNAGASSRKAPAPKAWSGWTWLRTTWRIGRSVRARIFGAEPGAVGEAAARVGDEDGVAADHEADVGDAVEVGGGGLRVGAAADEDAGGDLVEDRGAVRERGQAAETGGAEDGVAPGRRERAGLRYHFWSPDRVGAPGEGVNSAVGMMAPPDHFGVFAVETRSGAGLS